MTTTTSRRRLPVLTDDPTGLPLFVARWVPALLGSPLPHERTATCDECVMLPPDGEPHRHDGPHFGPETKCCTYVPRLASFLAGAILLDVDPALADGRRRVEARIAARTGLTPLGLLRTPQETWMIDNAERAFGKHGALRCPYYGSASGSCTVWRYRGAVCMTWFCKYDRAGAGARLWSAANTMVSVIERAVAHHCVVTLDLGTEALADLVIVPPVEPPPGPAAFDGTQDETEAREMWGKWYGRERQFYEACARIALDLDAKAVQELGGAELATATAAVRGLLRRLDDDELPARLKVKPFEIVSMSAGRARLQGYSEYDPIDVPAELVPALAAFDGRPTATVRAQVSRTHGIDLDASLLRQLIDFEILGATA
jgi:hypothetical protein